VLRQCIAFRREPVTFTSGLPRQFDPQPIATAVQGLQIGQRLGRGGQRPYGLVHTEDKIEYAHLAASEKSLITDCGWRMATEAARRQRIRRSKNKNVLTRTGLLMEGLGNCFVPAKLEKSSDEVENVKVDRPIGPASERSTFWPRI